VHRPEIMHERVMNARAATTFGHGSILADSEHVEAHTDTPRVDEQDLHKPTFELYRLTLYVDLKKRMNGKRVVE
jgi:hypothetical protein